MAGNLSPKKFNFSLTNVFFQVKVWFQNRRTKHKREETEEGQTQALKGAQDSSYAAQTVIEEEDDEDIDCE